LRSKKCEIIPPCHNRFKQWMNETHPVPLAPALEECLVTLDAHWMVDLGATPGARNRDDEQAGQSIPNPKERIKNSSAQLRRQHVRGREPRRTPHDASRSQHGGRSRSARCTGTHLRSQTTRLPPSKQMKQTTSSSSSLLLQLHFSWQGSRCRPGGWRGSRAIWTGSTRPPCAPSG